MLKSLVLFVSIFFFVQTGCAQDKAWTRVLKDVRKTYPDVHQLSTDSLATWLADKGQTQPMLIDVRELDEYAHSHIANAIQLDPDEPDFSVFREVDASTPIVLYCSVGFRSSRIADHLSKAGFTNVSNLEGSIFTWANEGRPIVQGDKPASTVHPYNRAWGKLLDKELRGKN